MLRSSADCARAFTECLRSSLAALSRRLELHSRTPGQNSAYGACHSSGSLLLEGGNYSPRSPPPVSAPAGLLVKEGKVRICGCADSTQSCDLVRA